MKVRPGTVIGIDSKTTRIAAVISTGPDSAPEFEVLELPKSLRMPVKCDRTHDWTRKLVYRYAQQGQPVYVFIEGPIVGRSIAGSLQLAKIVGVCIAGAENVNTTTRGFGAVEVHEVPISEWKLRVIGAGNARKEAVASWCLKYWRQAFDAIYVRSGEKIDQDLIDATAICFYGMKTVNLSNTLTPHRYLTRSRNTRDYLVAISRPRKRKVVKIVPVKKKVVRRMSRRLGEGDK